MSENIPESIPTSADPRSKRPVKKARPNNQKASQILADSVEYLFSHPDRVPDIPSNPTSTSLTTQNSGHAPPEIVQNVQGSSAGAGSGEFHVYKASRRREYERLRGMDEEVEKEEGDAKWMREKKEREERDKDKTRRNREKRERLKNKNKMGKHGDKAVEKGSKFKPRVDIGKDVEGLGGEGKEEVEAKPEQRSNGVTEVVGVIIHDDD